MSSLVGVSAVSLGLFWGLLVLGLAGDGLYRMLDRGGMLPRGRGQIHGAGMLRPRREPADACGLRILLALASVPWMCLGMDRAGIPITRVSLTACGLLLFAAGWWVRRRTKVLPDPEPAAPPAARLLQSPAALVLALATALWVVLGAVQAAYLPVRTYDSLVGFDLVGKALAFEGKLHSSVFTRIDFNAQAVYAPFAATNQGYWYLFHPAVPRTWVPLLAIGFLLLAWRQVRDWTSSPTAASLATFLMFLPKPANFALTISQTDLGAAVFTSLAVFAVVDLAQGRGGFGAPALFLLIATTVRSENLIFGPALMVVVLAARLPGRWKSLWFVLLPGVFFLLWNVLYVRTVLGYEPGIYFLPRPELDPRRMLDVFRRAAALVAKPELFGELAVLMLALPVLWALGRWPRTARFFGPRERDTSGLLLLLSSVLFCFYMGFFYMWNEELNPLWTMEYTFKRGFLRFVPGIAAAFVAVPPVLWALRRCDRPGGSASLRSAEEGSSR